MDRRELLQGAGAAALLAGTSHAKEVLRITITGLEVFRVKVNRRGNWVLFRMNTSAGLTGIGDASHGGRDNELVASLGRQFLESVKGRSIFDIEWLRKSAFPVVEQLLLLTDDRGGKHLSWLKDAFLFRREHLRC